MFNAITVIAIATLKESIRDRILLTLVVFTVLLLGLSVFLGSISLDQDNKIIIDLGLFGIFLFGVIITIFLGGSSVIKELDQRTIYSVLSRPIKRSWYIVGKFCGLSLTMLLLTVLMSAVYVSIVAFRLGWHSIDISLILALIYLVFEFMVLVALMLLFSSFASSVMATVYALAVFLIGHSSATFLSLIQSIHSWPRYIFFGLYYIFPNLEKFNIRNDVVYHLHPKGSEVGLVALYAIVYCTLLLILAAKAFSKQEL